MGVYDQISSGNLCTLDKRRPQINLLHNQVGNLYRDVTSIMSVWWSWPKAEARAPPPFFCTPRECKRSREEMNSRCSPACSGADAGGPVESERREDGSVPLPCHPSSLVKRRQGPCARYERGDVTPPPGLLRQDPGGRCLES